MLAKKFEDQAARTPDRPALKTDTETLTYRELNRYANRVARLISETGAGGTVGLLFEHGVHMIAAILGALKAGKTYVPLAADYPRNRLSYMLTHSQSSLIITNRLNQSFAGELAAETGIPVLDMTAAETDVPGTEKNPTRETDENGIAYILYTSGSTGKPKGVLQTHRNVDYFIRHWLKVYSITASDRMTLLSSFCHDASVMDIFGALHSGAALFPLNMKDRENTFRLSDFLIEKKITVWHSVPSLFSFFAGALTGEERFPELRLIILGGEAVRRHEADLLTQYFPQSVMANIYGQTESSMNSVCFIRPGQPYNKPLIGAPLDETQVFVIDAEGSPADPLEPGEILVASPYISPGYWRNPEASQAAFDYDDDLGNLYWTGDLGRLLPGGDIEFLGRRDHQVKIRGFRIEAGEIETQLLKHPQLKEAVVIAREDKNGDKHLAAYVTSTEGTGDETVKIPQLRRFLALELPDYMIPAHFLFLDKMPLTPTGKIDRQALPEPGALDAGEAYSPPRDPLEKEMVRVWADVLAADEDIIGIDTSIFQLGGHSLKAVILASRIHKVFNVEVSLREILQTATIRALVRIIRRREKTVFTEPERVEDKEYYPLSFNQQRLYTLHQLNTGSPAYNMPVQLTMDYDVDESLVRKVLETLVKRHESLRTGFKTVAGVTVQTIAETIELPFRVVDLSTTGGEAGRRERDRLRLEINGAPFGLETFPLFRAALVKLEPRRYEFLFNIHHILCDGWSLALLRKEFIQLYDADGNDKAAVPSPPLRYRDFCLWNNQRLMSLEHGRKSPSAAFWEKALTGGFPDVRLSHDFKDRAQKTDRVGGGGGAGYRYVIDKALKDRLLELAENQGATLFSVMFSVYLMLLSRLSGSQDVGCSVIVAGRTHASFGAVLGLFANSILLKTVVDENESFENFLERVNRVVLEAFQYQDYPMERVFEAINMRYPEVPVSFNMLNLPDAGAEGSVNSFEAVHIDHWRDVKFDTEPYIVEYQDGIDIHWIYRKSLFTPGAVEQMVNRYVDMLRFFAGHPGWSLKDRRLKTRKPISKGFGRN